MELEITWGRAARVWFAYVWRNLLTLVLAVILGGILGLVVGILANAVGMPREAGQRLTVVLSALVGIGVSIIPIRMILGKDFGEFRLVLLSNERAASERQV